MKTYSGTKLMKTYLYYRHNKCKLNFKFYIYSTFFISMKFSDQIISLRYLSNVKLNINIQEQYPFIIMMILTYYLYRNKN